MSNSIKVSTSNLKPKSVSTVQYAGTSASGSAGQAMPKVSTKEI